MQDHVGEGSLYNPSMPTTKNAIDATQSSVHLDAVRGAAALVVLLGHNRDLYFSSLNERPSQAVHASKVQELPARPAAPGEAGTTIGNEAVMIFFVLSGYLVGGSAINALRRNTWSWKNYLIKRLTRLWVVLIPALLLGVAVDYAGLHFFSTPGSIYTAPPQQTLVLSDIAGRLTARVVAGNAIFLQSILVSTAGTNDSLWSLANEFWYYIAFPMVLLALRKNQKLPVRCVYLAGIVGIGILVGKSVSQLFLIWILGALLSVVPLRVPRRPAKLVSILLALMLPIVFVAGPARPAANV